MDMRDYPKLQLDTKSSERRACSMEGYGCKRT